MTDVPDLSDTNALTAALAWLQGTLLGTVATTVAIIAVAAVGFLMLTGRIDVRRAQSARAHLAAKDDGLVEVAPLLERLGDFAGFLGRVEDQQATRALRVAVTTGRPVGNAEWINELERKSGRSLAPKKRGPRPRTRIAATVSCI